jgi:hypothetical protein
MDEEELAKKRQELMDEIREEVNNGVGWFAIAVAGPREDDDREPPYELPFVYTVGLASEGQPELIVSGPIPPRHSHAIIKTVIDKLRAGEFSYEQIPPEGLRVSEVLANDYDVLLKRVSGTKQYEYLTWAIQFQIDEGREASEVLSLQIVMPDPENRLPGDPGFEFEPSQEKVWE